MECGDGNQRNVRPTIPTVASMNKMPGESNKAERRITFSQSAGDRSQLVTLAQSIANRKLQSHHTMALKVSPQDQVSGTSPQSSSSNPQVAIFSPQVAVLCPPSALSYL